MDTSIILQEAGLTKGETRVYLALLKLGEITVGPIAKEANVSLSKIYEILYNLIKKGLGSSITKNNIKYFCATDPEMLLHYLKLKKDNITTSEKEIQKILPSLQKQKEKYKEREIATLFEGFKGIKTFYETLLTTLSVHQEVLVMGIPKYAAEKYEGYFLDWNRRRAQKRIKIKILFDYNVRTLGKKRERIQLTQTRYFPKNFTTPSWTLIANNTVATIHLTENPICVVINDSYVSESYKSFFKLLWNNVATKS